MAPNNRSNFNLNQVWGMHSGLGMGSSVFILKQERSQLLLGQTCVSSWSHKYYSLTS